jgi:hypothetical protein
MCGIWAIPRSRKINPAFPSKYSALIRHTLRGAWRVMFCGAGLRSPEHKYRGKWEPLTSNQLFVEEIGSLEGISPRRRLDAGSAWG